MQRITAPAIPADRRTLVIMGVSGSGKTEISQGVAQTLGWRHIEADQFHPAENVERMRAGIPLSDDDRIHWLDALIEAMHASQAAGESFVLACSALKQRYRDRLRAAVPGLQFAHLEIDYATALQRVGGRAGRVAPSGGFLAGPDDQGATAGLRLGERHREGPVAQPIRIPSQSADDREQ